MAIRYSEDFKREVTRAYLAGDKSTVEIAADYNIAKVLFQNGQGNMVKNASTNIPLQKQRKVSQLLK